MLLMINLEQLPTMKNYTGQSINNAAVEKSCSRPLLPPLKMASLETHVFIQPVTCTWFSHQQSPESFLPYSLKILTSNLLLLQYYPSSVLE